MTSDSLPVQTRIGFPWRWWNQDPNTGNQTSLSVSNRSAAVQVQDFSEQVSESETYWGDQYDKADQGGVFLNKWVYTQN